MFYIPRVSWKLDTLLTLNGLLLSRAAVGC